MNYSVRKISSPQDRSEQLYYCTAVSSGLVGIRDIAKRISQSCTLNTVDIVAVLEGFLQFLPDYLINGNSVKLSDFGILRLSIKSIGHLKATECSASDIKKVRVRFLPGTLLKSALTEDITYNLVTKSSASSETASSGTSS